MSRSPLVVWGFVVALIGVIVAGATWTAFDFPEWEFNAREAAGTGGPLLVAGAVLIAAGEIVEALRRR